jgi:hypothetical protein
MMTTLQQFAVRALGVLVFLCSSGAALAQCEMCKQTLANAEGGARMIAGINTGILFLLAAPFAIGMMIALALYRAYRRDRGEPA